MPFRPEQPQDRSWSTVFACAICLMLSQGTLLLYSFGIFVRPLTSEFHWTRTQISGALSIGLLIIALTSPFWGFLLDRFGPRRIVLPSVIALSIIYASLALMTSHLWHLYLAFALFALLSGGASPVGYASVLVRAFNRRLGLALGLALMGIGLGASILPIAAQHLVAGFGWRAAYGIIGCLTLAITLPAAVFATRQARTPAAARGSHRASVLPMIGTRAFLLMCGIFLVLGISSGGAVAHLVPMLRERGFAPDAAARVASLAGLAVIAGRGGIGWLLDRVNAARLLAGIATIVILALLLLAYAPGPLASYVAALLIGCVLGAEVDFTAFLVRRYFGNEAFGRLYGVAFGVFILGTAAGPLLLALSFDRLGGYHPGLLLFAALSLGAAAATFAMPSYTNPQPALGRL